jgi:hypothetical protein
MKKTLFLYTPRFYALDDETRSDWQQLTDKIIYVYVLLCMYIRMFTDTLLITAVLRLNCNLLDDAAISMKY